MTQPRSLDDQLVGSTNSRFSLPLRVLSVDVSRTSTIPHLSSSCSPAFGSNQTSTSTQLQGHTTLIKRWHPHPLPEGLTLDGRHVWEPPILRYTHLIGEEYEKKREAVLKHTKNDRAEATEILDTDIEYASVEMYRDCIFDDMDDANEAGDPESEFLRWLI